MTSEAEIRSAREARIAGLPFEAVGARPGWFRGSLRPVREVWANRSLLRQLVGREVRARYKDSSLGVLWSLFRPVVQFLVYYFAIGQILGVARSVPDFGIFVFTGMTTWLLFNETLTSATGSVIANAGLVKKIYLPREIFPLAGVGSALVNFAIQAAVLLVAIAVFAKYRLSPDLLLAPFALVTILVFATAIGLALSALNVYLRDIQHFVEVAIAVLFWASPIVYSFSFVKTALGDGLLMSVYLSNPVTLGVIAMQKALWAAGSDPESPLPQEWPDHLELRLLIALLVSLVLLWIAQRIFARLQGNFAQEL